MARECGWEVFLTTETKYIVSFLHQFCKSLIPTGCRTTWFNSDTNSWNWWQTPRIKGSVPQDCFLFRHQPQMGCSGYPHFCPDDYKFRVSHHCPIPRFTDLLAQLTELRKTLHSLLLVYYKGTGTQEQPNERDTLSRVWEDSHALSRCALFHATRPAPRGVHQHSSLNPVA